MRNKLFLILFLLSALFFTYQDVNAEDSCEYAEQYKLSALASNVKANYSVSEEPEVYFTININNLTSEIYATVKSDNSADIVKYEYSEENGGNVSFTSTDIYNKKDFVIEIYAVNPFCERSELRTITVTTPRYNPYYNYDICTDVRDFYLCQKWSDFELSYSELVNRVTDYKESLKNNDIKEEEKEESVVTKVINFVVKNYLYFMISGGVIVIAGSTAIIILKKRRVL